MNRHTRESVYNPDRDDIHRLCMEYHLNLEKVMKLIEDKNPNVHTMLIDAVVFRKACEDQTDDNPLNN